LLLPFGAAAVIGLPAAVIVTELASWHAAFLMLGLVNVVTAAGIVLALPRVEVEPVRGTLADHYRESYGDVVSSRTALLVLTAAVLSAAVWNGLVIYAGALFEDEVGVSGTELSIIFAGLGMSYVIGGAAGVALARRIPPRAIALGSAVCGAVLIIPLVGSTDVAAATVLFAMLFAASRAPGIAALNNMLMDAAPNARGTAVSSYGVVAASGLLIGAGLGGSAIELEGFIGMGVLFTILALASVAILARPLEPESELEPATSS
jgi:DHA1 family inner membrane transport protein